ncbi:MAG TPA: ABC transporter substrate-binding protein [Acidimicrobiales bacterium]|nr:ABC transporter substrate-binding protein [Acidimicrobiales bacterium]
MPADRWSRRQFLAGSSIALGGAVLAGDRGLRRGALERSRSAGRSRADAAASSSLTIALFQNPDTLDPAGTSLVGTGQVLTSMFDPLIWYIPNSGPSQHFPGLAESYSASDDATVYTFRLRRDVTFHDGTPFDAAAVKANFDHIVAPATKAKSELGELGPYKQTRVLDEYTAEVVFSAPNASFANEMSQILMSSPAALAKYGSDYGSHPVGTGPFVFEQFVNGEQVTVRRNPAYNWGPSVLGHSGPAFLQSVTYRVLPDPASQYDALQTGEVQVAQSLTPPDTIAALSGGKFKKLLAESAGLPYSLVLNTTRPPTDDVMVRQALEYATDRQSIIDTLYKGLYTAASSVLTPATLGYSASQALYSYDPAKAGHLLDAAGWTMSGGQRSKGGTPLELVILNAAGFGFDGITALLQSQFASVGVKSTISDQAFPAVNQTYSEGKMNLSDWFYADVDPSFLEVLFACDNIGNLGTGFNDARYCNASVDKMFAAANAEVSSSARAAVYDSIATELMRQAVAIPIYNLAYIFVVPSSLHGMAFTRSGLPIVSAVRY